MKRPFLIDTDTASDDAVALIMALRSSAVEVLAITTVAGNVPVQQATRNALYTAGLCGSTVPVYAGAEKPLCRERCGAEWFHGNDGLSDHDYPPPKRDPERIPALDTIIATVEAHPGALEIVTLGPLTNISMALQKRPDIARKVRRCVVMGGAPCCEGNVTPAAEYNIWCDPEAARIVVRSGLPIELVGWHLSRDGAVVNASEIEYVLRLDNPIALFAIECNSTAQQAFLLQTGQQGIALPDPVAMAVALDPSIVTARSQHFLDIATESELTRGMTVVDRLNVTADDRNRQVWEQALGDGHKAEIIWTIDNARWKKALFAALR
ncbi:MAG TPA: nucleoside hydrolase [Verrucomicrobiae bacterium]|nr:nucleoside hydrolase [Verrucomicrobiae bacterium]